MGVGLVLEVDLYQFVTALNSVLGGRNGGHLDLLPSQLQYCFLTGQVIHNGNVFLAKISKLDTNRALCLISYNFPARLTPANFFGEASAYVEISQGKKPSTTMHHVHILFELSSELSTWIHPTP